MKINIEKDRRFVDKGKVKVYSSVSGLSPLEDLYTIQKVIILPQGKEHTECKKEVEYIFVMLTGKVQITGSALKKETFSTDSVLVVSQDIKRLTLKNNEAVDAELLRVVIKRKEVPEEPIFQSLHPTDGNTSFRLLISPDAANGRPLWVFNNAISSRSILIRNASSIVLNLGVTKSISLLIFWLVILA